MIPQNRCCGTVQLSSLRASTSRFRSGIDGSLRMLYWSQTFGLSAEDLKNLVAQYGNSVDAVRQVLGKRASQRAH
jgi:hypothetical protein